MATDQGAWERLASHILERRKALKVTQQDVRAAGGPSTATMRLLEGAHQDNYQPRILAQLERGLRWEPGSVRAILAGGEPTVIGGEREPEDPAEAGRESRDTALAGLLDRIAHLDSLTRTERADLIERTARLYRSLNEPPTSDEHRSA